MQDVASSDRPLPLGIMRLNFLPVFSWLDAHPFLVLSNVPLSGWATCCLSITCWGTSWCFQASANEHSGCEHLCAGCSVDATFQHFWVKRNMVAGSQVRVCLVLGETSGLSSRRLLPAASPPALMRRHASPKHPACMRRCPEQVLFLITMICSKVLAGRGVA